ncbi:hypothetical protein HPB51_011477 [Rhipicephalus microplus]|uniref:Fibronectin type-III domain-containing protein n=1 Tax=Rhipicephalus microplus TaxID=6941 RepID=A0A9J6E8Q1_RHIMP|nr:hypothetical protein HPB51_011477 [Rhipicephalus microplus]
MIMRDAVVESSGNFDHLGFFNVHPNLSTWTYNISASIGNAAAAAEIRPRDLQGQSCPMPSNLDASDVAYNTITFRWDVTKYIPSPVHCTCMSPGNYGESCSASNTPKVCTTGVTGYTRTQSSLGVYTNYTMCVQTQCSASNFSTAVCRNFRTSPLAPSQPYQIFATKHSPSSLDVSWRFPTALNGPLDGYRIRWCQASNCVPSQEILPDRRTRDFRVTGLQPYRQYHVYVSGFNVDSHSGQTLYGAEASLSEYTLPTYPSEPSLSFTKVSTSQVNVVVGVPKYTNGPINGYVLTWCPKLRCYGDYVNTREIAQSNAGTQSVTGLQPWTEYEFTVRAFNTIPTDSRRAYSEEVKGTVVPMPFYPSRPIDLQVVRTRATAVDVSWKAPADPAGPMAGYRVRICPELGTCPAIGLVSRHKTLSKNVHNHSFYGLEPYAKYQVQVSAFNSLPDEKTAEGDVAVVSVSTTPSDDDTAVSSVFLEGDATSAQISDLLPYTSYAIRVARVNVDGNTTLEGAAAHGEGITDPEPSPPPLDLTVVAVKINDTVSSLTCSWSTPNATVNPPVEGYHLRVCVAQNATDCWDGHTTAEQLSYVVEAVPNFEDYVVTVNAYVLNHGRIVVGELATATASTAAPEVPEIASVNATAVNATTIYVEWKPVDSVNELEIVYNATALSEYGAKVSQVFVRESSAAFTELQAWTSYTIQVSACVKRGSKQHCGTATSVVVRTSPTESSMPTSIRTSTNGTAIQITWEEPLHPNGPLMGYRLTWWLNNATVNDSNGSADLPKKTILLKGPVTSHVIDELQSAATYVIEIRRVNRDNSTLLEGASARVEASTTPNTYPPPQDAKFTIRRLNTSHFAINLTWQPPHALLKADIERYEVFIQRIEEGKSSVVFTANAVTPDYTMIVTNMNPFVEYIVQIRAYARFGNTVVKGESAEVRVNVNANYLLVVSDVEVYTSSDAVATLISTETGQQIEGIVVSSLEATFTGLKLHTNYTAWVKACDVRGHVRKCGDLVEARFETPKQDVTPRPTDFSVVAVNSTTLKVTWELPKLSPEVDVTEYRILWWPSATNETPESTVDGHTGIHLASANESKFVITGLEAYKSYDVEIYIFYLENSVVKNVSVISRMQDKKQVLIHTVNSTAIKVVLDQHALLEPHLEGFKISCFIIANLQSFEGYNVEVAKVFTDGSSQWEAVTARSETVTDPKPFAKPTGVVLDSSSSGATSSLVIKWNAPTTPSDTPVEGYIVSICPRYETPKRTAACHTYNTSSSSMLVEASGLRSFTEYAVEITAYVTINGRVIKGDNYVTVAMTSPPPIPAIENPVVLNTVEGTSVKVSWIRPEALREYDVVYEVVLTEDASGRVLYKTETNATETTLESLDVSTEYTVTIIACLVSGIQRKCGNSSTTLFKTASKDVSKEPIHLHIKAVNSSALLVTWPTPLTNATTIEGYVVTWWKENETLPDGVTYSKDVPSDRTSFIIN